MLAQKFELPKKMTLTFLFIALSLVGCNSFEAKLPEATELTSAKPTCSLPSGISGSPKTIEQFVSMVNSLPKPVSVACVLSVLERPLEVSMTSNEVSAQPARGVRSPRIFIMKDKLIISIVPDGFGAAYIELSFLTSDTTSIKAEIPFPVVANINPADPYDHLDKNNRTDCGLCHSGETRATSITFAKAYESVAYKPRPETLVGLAQIKSEDQKCNFDLEPERCAIIRSFLGFGEVKTKEFPTAMPVF